MIDKSIESIELIANRGLDAIANIEAEDPVTTHIEGGMFLPDETQKEIKPTNKKEK